LYWVWVIRFSRVLLLDWLGLRGVVSIIQGCSWFLRGLRTVWLIVIVQLNVLMKFSLLVRQGRLDVALEEGRTSINCLCPFSWPFLLILDLFCACHWNFAHTDWFFSHSASPLTLCFCGFITISNCVLFCDFSA